MNKEVIMESEETTELTELEESEIALQAHAQDLRAEWDKPLTFEYRKVEGYDWTADGPVPVTRQEPTGRIASGILWIPPFIGPSPEFYTKKKVSKPKHKCAECGASHVDRRNKS
jgi:hypothetical protein